MASLNPVAVSSIHNAIIFDVYSSDRKLSSGTEPQMTALPDSDQSIRMGLCSQNYFYRYRTATEPA